MWMEPAAVPRREVLVALGDRGHLERAFADAGITGVRWVEPGAPGGR